jgi:hypothetical protein
MNLGRQPSLTLLFLVQAPTVIGQIIIDDHFDDGDLTGWSYAIEGINNPAGSPVTISETGTWADAGTDFASVFAGTDWHVLASNQGDPANNAHTLVLDRVELIAVPEPSTGLLGLMGLCLLARRRR